MVAAKTEEKLSDAEQLAELLAECIDDPYQHALVSYPWGEEGTVLANKKIREWQETELKALRDHLQNPETRFDPYRVAIASGHGIGKSALIGMIINWALDTMVDTRITCTANTDTQLKTKTVPEVTKWSRMKLAKGRFYNATTAIYSTDKEHVKSWRCDFVPWSAENSEAFAGLHNEGRRILLIFDEGSAIDDVIWEVAEGALTDENTEIIWIVFGNPTRNVGRFRECFRRNKKFWRTKNIDSRSVEGTNKKLFEYWEEQYGAESDFFKIRCLGQFPAQSARQLYNTNDVDAARGRHLKESQYDFAEKILTCDPAWEGDDKLVIGMRQGLKYQVIEEFPKNDNDIEIANRIARLEDEMEIDQVFIDGGMGTGIVSAGRTMGRSWQIVWFNAKSGREDCVNKRAEMHVMVKDWLKEGGSFEDDQELYDEMIACETLPTLDGKYKLVPKDDMKETLGWSPNKLDTLAMSFAYPVAKKRRGIVNSARTGRGRVGNRKSPNPHDRVSRRAS